MKILFLTTILLIVYSSLFGQIEITARVVDRVTSKPIKNSNVIILGTTSGTFTNALGFFKLTLTTSQKKIVISHVSYVTEPIEVPENITSFTIPLRKTNFLIPIDLKEYPAKFDTTKIKRRNFEPRQDSDRKSVV